MDEARLSTTISARWVKKAITSCLTSRSISIDARNVEGGVLVLVPDFLGGGLGNDPELGEHVRPHAPRSRTRCGSASAGPRSQPCGPCVASKSWSALAGHGRALRAEPEVRAQRAASSIANFGFKRGTEPVELLVVLRFRSSPRTCCGSGELGIEEPLPSQIAAASSIRTRRRRVRREQNCCATTPLLECEPRLFALRLDQNNTRRRPCSGLR